MLVWRTSNCSPGAEDILVVVVVRLRVGAICDLRIVGLKVVRKAVLAGEYSLEDSM